MNVTHLEVPAHNGKFTLFQCGDMHADLLAFDEKRFNQFQKFVIDHTKRGNSSVLIIQGDHIHGRLPGDKFFSSAILRPDARDHLDDYVNHMTDVMTGYYRPFVDAGIPTLLLAGNHDKYLKNVDISQMIARDSGATYVGSEALIRVRARDQYNKTKTKVLYAAHGTGGGSMPGAKLNKLIRSPRIAEADGYFFGHVHDSVYHIDSLPYLKMDGAAKLSVKEKVYSFSSSFNQSRTQGVFDYAADKSLPAVNMAVNAFVCDTWNDLWLPSRFL